MGLAGSSGSPQLPGPATYILRINLQLNVDIVIQRVQSVLLALSFLLNGGMFFNALYQHAVADPNNWIGLTFAVFLTFAAMLPLISIFLYKNRERQLKWVTASLWIQVITLGFGTGIYISLGGFGTYLLSESIGVVLLIMALLALLYARKNIRGDIDLVQSMDRIR